MWQRTFIMALQTMYDHVSVTCLSDIGLVRQNNEDSLELLLDDRFYVIADGMGGHQAGEVASRETVQRLCALFKEKRSLFNQEIRVAAALLHELIQEVNREIFQISRETPPLRGMGTTLCCVYLHPEGLIYGHVGDSRIYRVRKSEIEQLTHDHSLLRELIDLGQLSEQQAGEFLYKNIITKAIGTEPFVDPSVTFSNVESGDMILLCTDGLTDLLSQEEIKDILISVAEENIVKTLVKRAKQKGGNDNISVILIHVKK